jgi:predicted aspartyl protease
MENDTMGKVVVQATIENLLDVENREIGLIPPERVRSVEVNNAIADTGATTLMLPKRVIAQLGLRPFRTRTVRTVTGSAPLQMYSAVRLTVQGRDCALDVGEIGDEFPVLIGQVPLELLDFVVDPRGQRLIGNPEHGGEHMIDVL